MSKKPLLTVDLFAGAGGLSLGLHQAGLRGVFAVEKHPDAFATLEFNLRDHFDWPVSIARRPWDIRTLLRRHSSDLAYLSGKIDLIVGGPPCQGFSTAGLRRFGDARNKLVTAYVEAIRILRPRAVLLENVRGFAMRYKGVDNEPYLDVVLKALIELGYDDAAAQLIDVSGFGVPQRRQRWLVAATRVGAADAFFEDLINNASSRLRRWRLPDSTTASMALSDLRRAHGCAPCPDSVRFQTGILGPCKNRYQEWVRLHATQRGLADSHRYVNHRRRSLEVFRRMLASAPRAHAIMLDDRHQYGLRKRSVTVLDAALPAPTVTSIPDDLLHYEEPRVLTVRECARLQSFPDSFRFRGRYTSGGMRRRHDMPRYTQVANAVPPLFARHIGASWKEVLSRV